MALRIIGGEFGGRVLKSSKGPRTRPLLGQVREAVFNVLGGHVAGSLAWDLFAGTGASGLEALSRGASRVIFVEKAYQALSVLRANLDLLGDTVRERADIVRADAWSPPPLTPRGEGREIPPDLVFVDPPYAMVSEDPSRAVHRVMGIFERLAPGGRLVFHFPEGRLDRDDFDADLDVDLRVWGSSAVAILSAGD